jgi:hypothetical protein
MKTYTRLSVVLCFFFIVLYGCTTSIALRGLSSGAPVAFDSTGRGKGDSAWLARYDDVVQATLRAGKALSLKLEKKENGADKSLFDFVDEKGNELDIIIERRTATVTYIRFNVGLFGTTSTGRLMARQIVFETIEAGVFLRKWHPEELD